NGGGEELDAVVLLSGIGQHRIRSIWGPDVVDPVFHRFLQSRAQLSRLRTVTRERSIERDQVGAHTFDRGVHAVEGALRGAGHDAEHEGRHGGDETDAGLHGLARVFIEMMCGEEKAQAEADERAAERAAEDEQANGRWTHAQLRWSSDRRASAAPRACSWSAARA